MKWFLSVFILTWLVSLIAAVKDSFQWFRSRTEYRDVMTEAGLVRGSLDKDGECIEFLGVPYAAPPTGQYRFRAPLRPFSWNGIYEADHIVKCPQNGDGVEDCLVLNIFTPVRSVHNEQLPVLIYFHGGSFLSGQAPVQGAQFVVKQNIVVVGVNYRLGALGFLCLGVDEAPGNAGLKDQIAALEWIQRNIAAFGGDPNQVTIYGMSAGGASVELLVLSPRGEGLFKQAIVESASATSVWVTDFNPLDTALKMAALLNIPKFKKSKFLPNMLASYFKRIHARRLSQVNFNYYNSLSDGTFGFVPCIEKASTYNQSDAFITEAPYDILTKERYKKVPMMFFFAGLEGLNLRSNEYYRYKQLMAANFSDFLPADLVLDTPEIRAHVASNIKEFYFGNRTIGENVLDYLNYFGDHLILHGLLNSAEIHSRNGNPVYLMEFAYKGSLGFYDRFFDNLTLAAHGDVAKHTFLNRKATTKNDKTTVARVTRMIANFVKFGNPSPERSRFLPILWPTVKPGNVSCLYLDENFRVVDEPHWDAKEFWDGLYFKFRRQYAFDNEGVESESNY